MSILGDRLEKRNLLIPVDLLLRQLEMFQLEPSMLGILEASTGMAVMSCVADDTSS